MSEEIQNYNTKKQKEFTIDLLGIKYTVKEVPVVDKSDPCKGQINYLTNEILIDENMPEDQKEQTLMHELFHAICDITGNDAIGEDERAVQSISTVLHYLIRHNILF